MRAFAPDDILVERPADRLRDPALDLPRRQHRVDDAADLLHGDEILDPDLERLQVYRDLRDIGRPGIGP